MSELILNPAITKTDIEAPAINNNLDSLESVINGGIDGAFNLAPGLVGASAGTDLNSGIQGSGILLSLNALTVSGVTTNNIAAGAGITPGQLAAGGLTEVAFNATSGGQSSVVMQQNPGSGASVAILRQSMALFTGTSYGEGCTFTATTASGVFITTVTFDNPFYEVPVILLGYAEDGFSFNWVSPAYTTTVATDHCIIKSQIDQNLNFIALGTV